MKNLVKRFLFLAVLITNVLCPSAVCHAEEETDIFPCAAYSKRKETWYDRQLIFLASSLPGGTLTGGTENSDMVLARLEAEDGEYCMEVSLEGGSQRASIVSPARVIISEGRAAVFLEWSSPNFDYMLLNGQRYLPVNSEGNSVFELPILALDQEIPVIADTVAMSKSHEIAYTLTFHGDTMKKKNKAEGVHVVLVLLVIICLVGGGAAVFCVKKKNIVTSGIFVLLIISTLTGCSPSTDGKRETMLSYKGSMALQYAEEFSVDYYEGGYRIISIADGRDYLIVPEGEEPPEGLDKDLVIVRRPVKNIYLAATAAMDMFCELRALDTLGFSSQKAEGWSMEEPRQEMEKGNLLYAGKYDMPDYELITSKGCSLAIENTMVSHSPQVIEKLDSFGIPVLIDYSSYESHPLGRAEWIKLYGALLDKEEEAAVVFDKQAKIMERVAGREASGKTVAFFYITTNGMVNVRSVSDYVPKMIELAGGTYIFDDLGNKEGGRSSVTMQMEEFYYSAKDADYLIYNSTVHGEIENLEDLLEKEEVLRDFKAVRENHVWCTTRDLYQQPMSIGQMMEDIYNMLSGEENIQKDMAYLYRLR